MTTQSKLGDSGLTTLPLILGGNVFGWTADRAAFIAVLGQQVVVFAVKPFEKFSFRLEIVGHIAKAAYLRGSNDRSEGEVRKGWMQPHFLFQLG